MATRFGMFASRLGILVCLAVHVVSADDLLKPDANAPQYELSNLRAERDQFGRMGLVMDFKRLRAGEGMVSVSGKSGKGHITFLASIPPFQDTGSMRFESLLGGDLATDIELYLVQSHRLSGSKKVQVMVSNAVRLGNPGAPAVPRDWTAEERAAQKEFARIMADDSAHKPLSTYAVSVQVPNGSAFVPNTAKLSKGTRLHACYQNKWSPLTTLSENDDGTVNVRWDDFGPTYDCSMIRGELIIATNLLASLEKHPANRFPATVPHWSSESAKTTPPESPNAKPRKQYPVTIAIPDDSQQVPQDLKLKPGVPLQACYGGRWNPITTLAENDDGTLEIRWDEYGNAFDCSMVRAELIIKKNLAQQLRTNPSAVQIAAPSTPTMPRKSYPISIAIPSDSRLVPEGIELKAGTKLQACYAGKWNPITFLSTNADGSLNIHWDEYSTVFDCSMLRSELIIKKSLLAESKPTTTAAGELRTFTDITGKFNVKAKVIKQTDTQVTLLTEQGKEVTLPLTKLSESDQEFLRSRSSAKNPFE